MSDFDKEAEREKLRKKIEREEEKRQATEQMSELLLKGATMTNAHCSDCGDPIFRYDGQEFCPTCKRPVNRGDDANSNDASGGASDDGDVDGGSNGDEPSGTDPRLEDTDVVEVTDTSDRATVQFGASDVGGKEADAGDEEAAPSGARDPDDPEGNEPVEPVDGDHSPVDSSTPEPSDSEPTTSEPTAPESSASTPASTAGESGAAGDHLGDAQVLLARTVERFARLAHESDSPQAAREHLETARTAAEALAATKE